MNTQREQYLLLKMLGPEVLADLKACRATLAGGALTSLFTGVPVRDWDLYFQNQEDADRGVALFTEHGKLIFETDNAKTFKWGQKRKSFQLIVLPALFGEAQTIFSHFDFTICMAAYSFVTDSFVFHEDFIKHVAQRRLVFHKGTMFPICSLIRVNKYLKRGYLISGVELLKIALTIHGLNIETYKQLRAQLLGIDTFFLKDLTDQFKEGEQAEKAYEFETFMAMIEVYMQKLAPHLTDPADHDNEVEEES